MLELSIDAFRGRRPARASVRLTGDIETDAAGTLRILALSDKGPLTLVIDASRAGTREGDALVAAIRDRSGATLPALALSANPQGEAAILQDETAGAAVGTFAGTFVGTLEVEGVWRSRPSLDPARNGKEPRAWNFHVSRWHEGRVADRDLPGGGYAPRIS